MNWIIEKIIGLQLPKLVRHALAILGTWLATQGGGNVNVESLPELLTGVTCVLASILWSYVAKTPPTGAWLETLKALAVAIARQAVTVMASWLAMDPNAISNGEITTTAVLIAVANWFVSRVDSPDGTTGKGKPALKIPSNR